MSEPTKAEPLASLKIDADIHQAMKVEAAKARVSLYEFAKRVMLAGLKTLRAKP